MKRDAAQAHAEGPVRRRCRGEGLTRVLAVVASTFGWPAVQLAVFWLRFHRLPPGGVSDGLVFLPMGLVSGLAMAALWSRASSPRRIRFVGYGYLVATPVAFLGSLLGGLVLPGVWGPLVFGALPLIVGCGIGFVLS
jgi:hypothetical protein